MRLLFLLIFVLSLPGFRVKKDFLKQEEKQKDYERRRKDSFADYKKQYELYQQKRESHLRNWLQRRAKPSQAHLKKEWEEKQKDRERLHIQNRRKYLKKRDQEKPSHFLEFPFLNP